jgi:hypothetical protein
MTLTEVDLLSVRYRRMQAREDRRAAFAAWAQIELNRDTDKRSQPFTLEEITSWLGHGFQRTDQEAAPAPPPQPTQEELAEKIHMLHTLYSTSPTNGAGPAHD